MASRRKTRATLAQWAEIGSKLKTARDLLVEVSTTVGHYVPVREVDLLIRALHTIDTLRSNLENEMFKRSDITNTHIFYPGEYRDG